MIRLNAFASYVTSPWSVAALACLAVAGCTDGPTMLDASPDPELTVANAKGGKGGPPKQSDYALEVIFADGTDGIRSDGNPAYVHGDQFVSAVIRTNGMLYFQTFKGKRRDPVLRGLKVDLSSQEAIHSPDDLAEFAAEVGAAWPVFTSDVTLHTRDTDGGLYTMADGTLVDGGKIGFNDYGDGSWEWRLLFDNRVGDPPVADGVGLCVTRAGDTWTVTTDGGEACEGVDSVTGLWRVQSGVFTHVADFNTPMHLTLTRQSN